MYKSFIINLLAVSAALVLSFLFLARAVAPNPEETAAVGAADASAPRPTSSQAADPIVIKALPPDAAVIEALPPD
ncbi:MAG: hypothetical protein GTN49_12935 [candidate division Zixibacteria bacterium]|nr:hypothetical protein [candidate division Zixibacteria bacterium]